MDFDKIFNYILAFMAGVILYILCDKIFNIEGMITTGYIFESTEDLQKAVWEYYKDKENTKQIYGDISTWDVRRITDMSNLFADLNKMSGISYLRTGFNEDISRWDVSNVTNMSDMFNGAGSFNQNLSRWNVSNVTNMSGMFDGAIIFNGDISGWNVSNVTDMSRMFRSGTSPSRSAFNQDISRWNVSSVTNMSGMFEGATSFNQDLSRWNVSNVTNMGYMFYGATSFNGDLRSWGEYLGSVVYMDNMFYGATKFDRDLSSWSEKVGNVIGMENMFNGATSFNGDIRNWNVSNVYSFNGMFKNATSFNQDISGWKFGNMLSNMGDMFNGASSFNQDLSGWDFSPVNSESTCNIDGMWNNATSMPDSHKPNIICAVSRRDRVMAMLADMSNDELKSLAKAVTESISGGNSRLVAIDSDIGGALLLEGEHKLNSLLYIINSYTGSWENTYRMVENYLLPSPSPYPTPL